MEFDSKSIASSIGTRKVVLKLDNAQRGVKAYRTLPENFDGLMSLIEKYQKTEADPSTVKVSYVDHAGDVIGVSDDEDLMTAYEFAECAPTRDIKLQIHAKPKQESSLPIQPKLEQVSTTVVDEKKPIAEKPQQNESESSSSESDQQAPLKVPKQKADKAMRKKRKHIRKMVRRAMKEQSREVIKNLIEEESKEPQVTEETKASESAQVEDKQESEAVHHRYECDGCGMAPIIGPRYKSTVTKNFDYCSACEATKKHPHPFLKISKPEQAPRVMFTVIDENTPGEADIDMNIGDVHQAFEMVKNKFAGMGVPDMQKVVKDKIGCFMQQMLGAQAAQKEAKPMDKKGADSESKGRKNPKRAIPVSHPGEKVHVASPGDQVMIELTFRNGGYSKYPEGFHLEAELDEALQTEVGQIKVPLPEIEQDETFTVQVPVQILETAKLINQVIVVNVGVTNRKGKEVGQAVPLKFKIIEKIDETELYAKAIQLMEHMGLEFEDQANFDKVIQVLKDVGYDVEKACALFLKESRYKE